MTFNETTSERLVHKTDGNDDIRKNTDLKILYARKTTQLEKLKNLVRTQEGIRKHILNMKTKRSTQTNMTVS